MKAGTLVGLLGAIFAAALLITPPAFAYYSDYSDYGSGYSDPECDDSWEGDQGYFSGGYGDYGYRGSPDSYSGDPDYDDSYGYSYEHPSGLLGYWGKDAEHHRRGHWHHHWF